MFDNLDNLIHSDPFAKTAHHPVLHLKEGERREVCILFADAHGFTALSERLDHEVVHTLMDKLMQLFTSRIKHFGGFIDKYEGDLVMALFGAKTASEQDTDRAIEAGLQMLGVLEQFNKAVSQRVGFEVNIAVRIGINTGEVTTGKVGEKREGDFTVYGDAVNLASRLESSAPLNRIMLSHATMQKAIRAFDFEPHGSIQVKGKADPIDAWLVIGSKGEQLSRWQVRWTAFVGREAEMTRLQQKYEQVIARLESPTLSTSSTEKPVVVCLKGEAGMGKSRLVDEFLKQMGATSFYLHGTTPKLVQSAYGLFISMIRKQFGISLLDDQTAAKEILERGMEELGSSLDSQESRTRFQQQLPIVGYLLNLTFEDVRLTLPPKELQPHLQTAIRYFIEVCAAKANRSGEPLVVVLEDLHWTDAPSLATLEFLLFTLNLEEKRAGAALGGHSRVGGNPIKQILFLLTYRPEYLPTRGVLADSEYVEVELSTLTPDLARALTRSIAGETELPPETMTLVMERSAGNPFFIEEWASYIAESKGSVAPASLPVPSTLQALILARMDQLEAELKLLLQKAAVLGREFYVNVVEAMEKLLEGKSDLGGNFSNLEENQFLLPLPGKSFSAYMFKHILTQEVAYGTLLIANRKVLHRIAGEVLEELFADSLQEHWHALADHYEKGEVWVKAAVYLLKAVKQAREQYDSQAELSLADRLLSLGEIHPEVVEPAALVRAKLGKGDVLGLTGSWKEAEVLYQEALASASQLTDKEPMVDALISLGGIRNWQGSKDEAMECYQKALLLAEEIDDQKGIARSVGAIGQAYVDVGDYDRALECYHRQLSLAEQTGDRRLLSKAFGGMGSVYLIRGDYERAQENIRKSLSIYEEMGDKFHISQNLGDLGLLFHYQGDYDHALEYFYKNLSIAEELGDKRGISIALGNIGNVYHIKGDYDRALDCHQKNLALAKELGNKRGITAACGNIGNVHFARGDFDNAIDSYRRALAISEEMGDRWGISVAIGNIGSVLYETGDFQQADEQLERAILFAREMNVKPMLAEFLPIQSKAALAQSQITRAREICNDALAAVEELHHPDFILMIQALSLKIDFLSAEDDAARAAVIEALTAMLLTTEDDEAKAEMNYELVAMHRTLGVGDKYEDHRLQAVRLYENLYAKVPKFTFKKRIDELKSALPPIV